MSSRLDILLYAHDGRGLGHASRSAAIGMALRRLFPQLNVLLLTGCTDASALVGGSDLDWLKLPSYATEIRDGKSRGATAKCGLEDGELGRLRAQLIASVVDLYKPRVVLTDHQPQGKHHELLPALESFQNARDTKWILGVRGVIGKVGKIWDAERAELFQKHYSGLFWYGDSDVLGFQEKNALGDHFDMSPVETGYVSRLKELWALNREPEEKDEYALVGAMPWSGPEAATFLDSLAESAQRIGDGHGLWRLFVRVDTPEAEVALKRLRDIPWVRVTPPDSRWADVLPRAKTVLGFGGYNTLTDLLAVGAPAVTVKRSMADKEQDMHLERLSNHAPLFIVDEAASAEALTAALGKSLKMSAQAVPQVRLDGAERAARALHAFLETGVLS